MVEATLINQGAGKNRKKKKNSQNRNVDESLNVSKDTKEQKSCPHEK